MLKLVHRIGSRSIVIILNEIHSPSQYQKCVLYNVSLTSVSTNMSDPQGSLYLRPKLHWYNMLKPQSVSEAWLIFNDQLVTQGSVVAIMCYILQHCLPIKVFCKFRHLKII